MSGRFTVGAIFGALAALSPPITLASFAIGGWVLMFHGVPDGGETATDGVVWASVWATVLFGVLLAIVIVGLGLLFEPLVTVVTVVGMLILYVLIPARLESWNDDADGEV